MTHEQCKKVDEIWAAYRDGKSVEWCASTHEDARWILFSGNSLNEPAFLDPECKWRIKPEPKKPREIWVCPICNETAKGMYCGQCRNKEGMVLYREVID